jgi:hypothetical protein
LKIISTARNIPDLHFVDWARQLKHLIQLMCRTYCIPIQVKLLKLCNQIWLWASQPKSQQLLLLSTDQAGCRQQIKLISHEQHVKQLKILTEGITSSFDADGHATAFVQTSVVNQHCEPSVCPAVQLSIANHRMLGSAVQFYVRFHLRTARKWRSVEQTIFAIEVKYLLFHYFIEFFSFAKLHQLPTVRCCSTYTWNNSYRWAGLAPSKSFYSHSHPSRTDWPMCGSFHSVPWVNVFFVFKVFPHSVSGSFLPFSQILDFLWTFSA